MKKIVSIICLLIVFSFCFTACKNDKDNNPPEVNIYNTLNSVVKKEYSNVTMTVKVQAENDTLNGLCTITKQSEYYLIEYSYEKLNIFEEVGGVIIPPTESKSTLTGSMKVKDGKIIEQNGENLNITLELISARGLNFKESYFENIVKKDNVFKADVSNVEDFLGFGLICSDMKVDISYSSTKLNSLKLEYTSEKNSRVEINYSFN